jgi:hypothetical protein
MNFANIFKKIMVRVREILQMYKPELPEGYACRCCGKTVVAHEFYPVLWEFLRLRPQTIITSGYRCEAHNKKVGGKKRSAHVLGAAIDIACLTSEDRFDIVEKARACGINRMGIYKTKHFIHLDVGDRIDPKIYKSRVIW